MKWTKTRLNKFIKRGGVVKVIEGTSPPDNITYIHSHQLSRMYFHDKEINAENVDEFTENHWSRYVIPRISPTYFRSLYYLNQKKYEEMKADALDSKNAD